MAAAAECVFGRAIARTEARPRVLEIVEPTAPKRQHRNDSALLDPGAGAALALAASPVEDEARPVAVVLQDGTVRSLERGSRTSRPFSSGRLSGSGWTLWWERRAYTPKA